MLPPLDTILRNNQNQLASVTDAEVIGTMEVTPELKVVVSMQERSEYDPHLVITAGADAGTIYVIINRAGPRSSLLA